MLCEKILGNLQDPAFAGCTVDYVEVPWHDAFKKLHRLTTRSGAEIGILLDDSILTRGLREGDVLYQDGQQVVAVTIPPCQMIVIDILPDHASMAVRVAWEVGNRHAPLFRGDTAQQLLVIYDAPMLELLQKLHGVACHVEMRRPEADRRVSAAAHSHSH